MKKKSKKEEVADGKDDGLARIPSVTADDFAKIAEATEEEIVQLIEHRSDALRVRTHTNR